MASPSFLLKIQPSIFSEDMKTFHCSSIIKSSFGDGQNDS